MGRRDGGGKRKTWMIESGDWEKLYEALLKAKEKNNMLEVRLQRKTDLIEMQRRHRDKALFNDIFEQRKLVFKYKAPQEGETPRGGTKQEVNVKVKNGGGQGRMPLVRSREKAPVVKTRQHVVNGSTDPTEIQRKFERKLTLPNLTGDEPITTRLQAAFERQPPIESSMRLSLPTVKQYSQGLSLTARPAERNTRHSLSNAMGIQATTSENYKPRLSDPHLQRFATMPNLHTAGANVAVPKEVAAATVEDAPQALWVGEPEAISSVRRPRLKPEEMKDHSKPQGEARKLLIELATPNTCSRNCAGAVKAAGTPSLLTSKEGGVSGQLGRSMLALAEELSAEEILGKVELMRLYTKQVLSSRI